MFFVRGFATPLGVATPLLVFPSRQDRPSETGDHLHREKLSIPCRGELVFQEFFSGE